MASQLIKIDIPNNDCKNIYYVDNNEEYAGKVIKTAPKSMKNDYKLTLRITVVTDSGQRKQAKKTYAFKKSVTLVNAIKQVNSLKLDIKTKLEDGTLNQEKNVIPTLKEAWNKYIEDKKNLISPRTYDTYKLTANKWILSKKDLCNRKIDAIDSHWLQSIVNEILEDGKSPRTSKSIKELLRPMFRKYVLDGTIKSNPADLIKIPKFHNEVEIKLSDEQTQNLYKTLYNYPIEPFRSIFVWLTHGRRLNEVLSLEWSDIDLDNNEYTIKAISNKARKGMIYTLTSELLQTLKNIGIKQKGLIFPSINDSNKKMNHGTIRNHWELILKQVEIEKLRIHDLRHIIGNTLVSNGKSLEQVASVLGHTSIAITKRYSKVRKEVSNEALEDFFQRVR